MVVLFGNKNEAIQKSIRRLHCTVPSKTGVDQLCINHSLLLPVLPRNLLPVHILRHCVACCFNCVGLRLYAVAIGWQSKALQPAV
jgi:hypothetical protein